MITESIKKLLGDDLAAKVEDALKGKGKDGKEVEVVVGNDGSFVPADKHDGLKTQSESSQKALKAAAEALKAIGGSGNPEKIAEDVKVAQTAMETLTQNHDAELRGIRKNTALRLALNGKVHDPADVIGQLKLDDIEVDEQGNLKSDIASVLKPIQEKKPYLFIEKLDETKPPDIKGATPADPGEKPKGDAQAAGPTIF